MTPGTECPAEMNFYFPDTRALCMAENATHNLHNLLTLRGAAGARPPHLVALPRRGHRAVRRRHRRGVRLAPLADLGHATTSSRYLTEQRDLYAYLHDQTLRLINQGYVGSEIAEMIEMPPALDAAWHTHGYYGSVSHNVKAIYQRYLGWYDGNPAHLWQHPPEAAAPALRRASSAASTRPSAKARRVRRRRRPPLRRRARQPRRLRRPGRRGRQERAGEVFEQLGYGAENAHLAQQLPHRRPGAAHGVIEPTGVSAARAWRRPSPSPSSSTRLAIRIDGTRGLGYHRVHPLALHRHRRDLPDGAVQRRPHSPPDQPDQGRQTS